MYGLIIFLKMVIHIAEPYTVFIGTCILHGLFCGLDFYRQLQFFLATSHFSLSEVSNNLTYVKLCSVCRRIADKVQSRKCVEDISTIRVYRKKNKGFKTLVDILLFFFFFNC